MTMPGTRVLIGLCASGGVCILVVVGWLTGFFGRIISAIDRQWQSFIDWLNNLSIESVFAAAGGGVLALIILLIFMLAVTDN